MPSTARTACLSSGEVPRARGPGQVTGDAGQTCSITRLTRLLNQSSGARQRQIAGRGGFGGHAANLLFASDTRRWHPIPRIAPGLGISRSDGLPQQPQRSQGRTGVCLRLIAVGSRFETEETSAVRLPEQQPEELLLLVEPGSGLPRATSVVSTLRRDRVCERDDVLTRPCTGGLRGSVEHPATAARQISAERLTQSTSTVPQLSVTATADVTELVALRSMSVSEMVAAGRPKISMDDLVVRASALTLRAHPDVSSAAATGRVAACAPVLQARHGTTGRPATGRPACLPGNHHAACRWPSDDHHVSSDGRR